MSGSELKDWRKDLRLIEAGFPCHQVGAETQRERDTGQQPPTARLHVWWARRPLTPSRAAILASLLPADSDPDEFLRELGIEKVQAMVGDVPWTLTGKLLDRIEVDEEGREWLPLDGVVIRAMAAEQQSRNEQRGLIDDLMRRDPSLAASPILRKWRVESRDLPLATAATEPLTVERATADPAWFAGLLALAREYNIRVPNLYGYDRAHRRSPTRTSDPKVVLDPTAGGGSIPFEALRLGHRVIANELNPVATTILRATLDYPARFGLELVQELRRYGRELKRRLDRRLEGCFATYRRSSLA
jgi:putative DNA methylase